MLCVAVAAVAEGWRRENYDRARSSLGIQTFAPTVFSTLGGIMQCPRDGNVLIMSERSGVEIDYCPTCRGVWLDRGELDKILKRAAVEGGPAPQASIARPGYALPDPRYPPGTTSPRRAPTSTVRTAMAAITGSDAARAGSVNFSTDPDGSPAR